MSNINFYNLIPNKEKTINPGFDKHEISNNFRMLIAAPSGAGKTSQLCNLLIHMNKTFHQIIICVKSADEPLYRLIDDKLDGVLIFENGEVPPISNYSSLDQKTNRLKRIDKLQRLIVFDDLILDKKANKVAEEYYIKARKLGFSMIYIGQSYYQIPKMIRDNCQYFILGRNLLKKDLKMILQVFPTELPLDDFVHLYNELTTEPLDTIIINIEKKFLRKNIIGDKIQL